MSRIRSLCLVLILAVVVADSLRSRPTAASKGRTEVNPIPRPRAISVDDERTLKILFVGNSFTYGPSTFGRPELELHNIPRLFKLVAESLGRRVQQQEDTIGGCTLYSHLPSVNPDGRDCGASPASCQLIDNARINASEECTISTSNMSIPSRYAPCPQRFGRQAFGPWDVVVLNDWSNILTVKRARELMVQPAFREYKRVFERQGRGIPNRYFGQPVLAAYSTWAYPTGSHLQCPGGTKDGCWPLGSLDDLSECSNSTAWYDKTRGVPCQTYAIHRGAEDMLNHGADVLVPTGLAWQAARGVTALPEGCKAAIDSEYSTPSRLANLQYPLQADPGDAHWEGERGHRLFLDKGPDYDSKYCDNCTVDHHQSELGAYLNALVFYATLFGESPIGAAFPDGLTEVDDIVLKGISSAEAHTLQRIAHKVVLGEPDSDRVGVWWKGGMHARQGSPEGFGPGR